MDVIAIWVFNALGVISGFWSPAFTTIITVLTLGISIISILVSRHYLELKVSEMRKGLLGTNMKDTYYKETGMSGVTILFPALILLLIISTLLSS